MARKSSASSRPEKLARVKAEHILGKQLSKRQLADLARLKSLPDTEIDFSDIPPLTEAQLATAFRPKRQLIAVRLDREVLDWLRAPGAGYSTRINNILRTVMDHQRAAAARKVSSKRPPNRASRHR